MKSNYDFSKGKRGAIVPKGTKTAVYLRLDPRALLWLQEKAEEAKVGYQTFLNHFLLEQWEKDNAANATVVEDLQLIEKALKRLKKKVG
ncbi:MAG: CopG family transcriptional regulator [Oligoflexia bacterium]|nr:CopG family transcriptional regulator [Oligoflexia bacterium]MBF0366236.1 CopG family transcriptional regulator [Oligoflexia bacterium]